jgi:hypothetical protein
MPSAKAFVDASMNTTKEVIRANLSCTASGGHTQASDTRQESCDHA